MSLLLYLRNRRQTGQEILPDCQWSLSDQLTPPPPNPSKTWLATPKSSVHSHKLPQPRRKARQQTERGALAVTQRTGRRARRRSKTALNVVFVPFSDRMTIR